MKAPKPPAPSELNERRSSRDKGPAPPPPSVRRNSKNEDFEYTSKAVEKSNSGEVSERSSNDTKEQEKAKLENSSNNVSAVPSVSMDKKIKDKIEDIAADANMNIKKIDCTKDINIEDKIEPLVTKSDGENSEIPFTTKRDSVEESKR